MSGTITPGGITVYSFNTNSADGVGAAPFTWLAVGH